MKKTVRVLVVDDSPVALAAICSCLKRAPEIEIIGTAKNGFELPEKAEELQPDVIVTDLHMPRMNGLECTLRLRELMPTTRFIIISDMPGALGRASDEIGPTDRYFDKSTSPEEVLNEIRSLFPEAFGKACAEGTPIDRRQTGALEHTPEDDEHQSETSGRGSTDKCQAEYC